MTDESKPATAAQEPAKQETSPTEPSPPPVTDEPWRTQVWVRGGTTTSRFDNLIAKQHADAEARRAEQDADRAAVRNEGARMYSHNFTDSISDPKVILRFNDTKLGVDIEMMCELVLDDVSGENLLLFLCPDCLARGIPSDLAQRRVSERARAWHLDTRDRGKMGRYTDAWGRPQMYLKAGTIVDTDILRCPEFGCTFACKIDGNIMRRV